MFDKEFGAGRPIGGASSKFKSALIPWAACLCLTSTDANVRKVALKGHKMANEQQQYNSSQQATSNKPKSAVAPSGPGKKANKDIESLHSILKRPVNSSEAMSVPQAQAVPQVAGQAPQQGSLLVSSRAPESLGGFRIHHRVGGPAPAEGGAEAAPPSSKKEKISRKSDGTGFAALAAAAAGDSDDGSSGPTPAQSANKKSSKKAKKVSSVDGAKMLLEALKPTPAAVAVGEEVNSPAPAPKKNDAEALKSLLSILKSETKEPTDAATPIASTVEVTAVDAKSAPSATEASPVADAPKKPSKMVPASVLLKKKKSNP